MGRNYNFSRKVSPGVWATLRDAITWTLIIVIGNMIIGVQWKTVWTLRLILDMLVKIYDVLGIIFK